MNITISELLAYLTECHISYHFIGDKKTVLTGFSDPSEYHTGTIIWLGNSSLFNRQYASAQEVSLLLINNFEDDMFSEFPNRLQLEDPRNVFNGLVEHFYPIDYPVGVEKDAYISANAVIGERCYIGHGSYIDDDVVIGDDTVIQNNVSVRAGTKIGKNCFIGDCTSIGNAGFGFRMTEQHEMFRLPHLGSVLIGDCVEIGSNVCICRGTFKNTKISDGVKIDSNTYIGHNVTVEHDTLIINSRIDGNSCIGSGSTVINSDVVNRVKIGDNVFVGIGSVVISDIPNGVRVFGVPAKIISKSDHLETGYNIDKSLLAGIESSTEDSKTLLDQQLLKDVISLLAEILEVSVTQLSESTEINDLEEWDSLAQLKIIVGLESKFNVEIPIDQAMKLSGVKAIALYIQNAWDMRGK